MKKLEEILEEEIKRHTMYDKKITAEQAEKNGIKLKLYVLLKAFELNQSYTEYERSMEIKK